MIVFSVLFPQLLFIVIVRPKYLSDVSFFSRCVSVEFSVSHWFRSGVLYLAMILVLVVFAIAKCLSRKVLSLSFMTFSFFSCVC